MDLYAKFAQQVELILPQTKRLLIAYSGGLDSTVLLHLCSEYQQQQQQQQHPSIQLLAIHVNHGLQSFAESWQQHCQQQALDLGIDFIAEQVQIKRQSRQSLEALARDARYQIFAQQMQVGDVLLTGQHADDQLETLLLALKRGSGVTGLAAMPKSKAFANGSHFRPLLGFRKQQLEEYAQLHQLKWIEDPSNAQDDFDRNFLRNQVIPVINQRWPQFVDSSLRTAELCQDAHQLHLDLAQIDAQSCCRGQQMSIQALLQLSPARIMNLLRYWLQSNQWPLPSRAQLQQIWQQSQAPDDAQIEIKLEGGVVRRYQGLLYLVNITDPEHLLQAIVWQTEQALKLPAGWQQLSLSAGGHFKAPQSGTLRVQFRHQVGNPKLLPYGRQGRRSLKKLLQELAIPSWQRQYLPLLFDGEQLVAIGDMLIMASHYEPDFAQGSSLLLR